MPIADCRVCTRLPRMTSGHELAVWNAAEPLVPPVPHDEVSAFLTCCPDCGNIYVYDLSGDYDDQTLFTTTTLERLSFVRRLQRAAPPERAVLEAELAGRILAWRGGLDEGSAWAQQECAWNLCSLADLDGSWAVVVELLRSRHVAVRVEATRFLLERAARLPDSVLDETVPLVCDPNEWCRHAAIELLTPRRIARGEAAAVFTELLDDGDLPRNRARLTVLLRKADAAICEEIPRLVPWLSHTDQSIRDHTARLVRRCLKDGAAAPRTVPLLVELLRGEDPMTAVAALTALSGHREPCDAAVPWIEPLCRNPATSIAAYGFLAAQASLGADLHRLLPVLRERLDETHDPATPAKILLAMLAHTDDPLPVIRAMLPGLRGLWAISLALAIRSSVERGCDLTPLLPDLRAVPSEVNGHLPEIIALIEDRRLR